MAKKWTNWKVEYNGFFGSQKKWNEYTGFSKFPKQPLDLNQKLFHWKNEKKTTKLRDINAFSKKKLKSNYMYKFSNIETDRKIKVELKIEIKWFYYLQFSWFIV